MGRRADTNDSQPERTITPSILTATTPEGRENELINMAYEEVAMRIHDHTATAAELVHFLKMGSERERLEREDKEAEMELKRVKKVAIEEGRSMESIAKEAMEAFKRYAGVEDEDYV